MALYASKCGPLHSWLELNNGTKPSLYRHSAYSIYIQPCLYTQWCIRPFTAVYKFEHTCSIHSTNLALQQSNNVFMFYFCKILQKYIQHQLQWQYHASLNQILKHHCNCSMHWWYSLVRLFASSIIGTQRARNEYTPVLYNNTHLMALCLGLPGEPVWER